ncbi:hypothetical protein [Kitasatospora sp. NPDC005751]|uniref:hypothetical protein n=1 Tax=Kitasatospora sp. NPDC005751 TaxID=3157064 RepID=UPI0033FC486C
MADVNVVPQELHASAQVAKGLAEELAKPVQAALTSASDGNRTARGSVGRRRAGAVGELVDSAVAAFTQAAGVGERHAHWEAAWLLWKYRGLEAAVGRLRQRVKAYGRRAVRELAGFLREAGRPEQALEWYLEAADGADCCVQPDGVGPLARWRSMQNSSGMA